MKMLRPGWRGSKRRSARPNKRPSTTRCRRSASARKSAVTSCIPDQRQGRADRPWDSFHSVLDGNIQGFLDAYLRVSRKTPTVELQAIEELKRRCTGTCVLVQSERELGAGPAFPAGSNSSTPPGWPWCSSRGPTRPGTPSISVACGFCPPKQLRRSVLPQRTSFGGAGFQPARIRAG